MKKKSLCWLRRDLRLHDHHALSFALHESKETFVCFIFDKLILSKLHSDDRRMTFIFESLIDLEKKLNKHGSSLIIRYGDPVEEIPKLTTELNIELLTFNRDYEPYAKKRDAAVEKILHNQKIDVQHFKDHVTFEKNEILNGSGEIYKVFTPYKNKWLEKFRAQEEYLPEYNCPLKNLAVLDNPQSIVKENWMKKTGFIPASDNLIKGGVDEAKRRLAVFDQHILAYKVARDFPHLNKTSLLSAYIRMGNISIRDMIRTSLKQKGEGPATWLSEIIWRDFYQMILDVYPRIEHRAFRSEYDAIEWEGTEKNFKLWCEGMTGYPLVDAAMRCLNATGFMHNRLRMVVASFLTKTLLMDWKKGERYFADKLFDYDLAANNGGWQWSASTGVDAQPYFRIFNPYNQSEKFDPDGLFIRKWCPELSGFSNREIHAPQDTEFPAQDKAGCFIGRDYPAPIVSYSMQRDRALKMYKKVKN